MAFRLINRPDYSDTLAAIEDALVKTQQFKAEIVQVAQLVNDLRELNNRIDRRGRRLLDGPTSSTVADIGKSVSMLSAAKIPLSSEARLQLSNTRLTLTASKISRRRYGRRRKAHSWREMPSRRGVWRFSVDRDKITDDSVYRLLLVLGVLRLSTI